MCPFILQEVKEWNNVDYMERSEKIKIAIISAYIGNGGTSGDLKFTPQAKAELADYGVDVYYFNDKNIDVLNPFFEPTISRDEVVNESWRSKILSKIYSFRYKQSVYPSEKDNYTRLIAKIPKILFYKVVPQKYDYYIWLDSKFTIEEHWLKYILWLLNKYKGYDIVTSRHSERCSIKEEFDFMKTIMESTDDSLYNSKIDLQKKYDLKTIWEQIYVYLNDIEFVDDMLYELTMIIYSKSMLDKQYFSEEWYAHNYYYSIQDQVSFPFLVKKHKINVCPVYQRVFDMPFAIHEYSWI